MEPLQALRHFMADGPSLPALVGFSGGADSTALLLALHLLGWPVEAVHFHHHLRGEEADEDARWCVEFARQRGITIQVVDLQVAAQRRPGESIEAAARHLRLQSWAKLSGGKKPVFLAHHADDCLEEFFLRLGRGSNSSGLTGIRSRRVLADGTCFFRPFIQCRKAELLKFLEEQGVRDWRYDSTNGEEMCRRNTIRQRLLPQLSQILGGDLGMMAALDALRDDAQALEDAAREFLAAGRLDLGSWQRLPRAILARAVRMHLNLPLPPSRESLLRLERALQEGAVDAAEQLVPLGGGVVVAVSARGINWPLTQLPPLPQMQWRWQEEPRLELPDGSVLFAEKVAASDVPIVGEELAESFDALALPEVIQIRALESTDRICLFGQQSLRSLKNIMVRRHIPWQVRGAIPVLLVEPLEIIWMPGVGRSEFGRIHPGGDGVRLSFVPSCHLKQFLSGRVN